MFSSSPDYGSFATSAEDEASREERSNSNTIVLCIHGNKYGVARCCAVMPSPPPGQRTPEQNATFNESLSKTADRSVDDAHCHPPDDGQTLHSLRRARSKLIVASILCVFFMVVEVIGGYLANSLAIATDAAHLLTDFSSFMVSLFSLWMASRPATRRMSFGYHRAEVLGATISILFIWVLTGILVFLAIQRIITMDFELDPAIMLVTSGIGVAINIIMGAVLHQSAGLHGHSHGGLSSNSGQIEAPLLSRDTDTSRLELPQSDNINVRAAFIHVIGDLIQSLGVLIAAAVIYFRPEWTIIDPICSCLFSVIVLGTTLMILRDTINVLMEGTPSNISHTQVENLLLGTPDILSVHGLRIWSLSIDKTAMSAHLAIRKGANPQEVLTAATANVRSQYNIYEMTLQVEIFAPSMEECNRCQPISSH